MPLNYKIVGATLLSLIQFSCGTSPVDVNRTDTTPTSGTLNVYYEAGLEKLVQNQAYTFQALYERARLKLFSSTENQAIQALYNDSCESIIITRPLSENELNIFSSKKHVPKYSMVAKTGMALLCHSTLPLKKLSYAEVIALLSKTNTLIDTLGKEILVNVLIDQSGSAINNYIIDSLLVGDKPARYISSLNSAKETVNYVVEHPNAIAFIDFAELSDVDDSLYIALSKKVKTLAIGSKTPNGIFEKPNQSSFKLNTYPFTRNIYVVRKTGDFTLAKGFESFIAGPKGQTIFLKQGILPSRQQERGVNVRFEALELNK